MNKMSASLLRQILPSRFNCLLHNVLHISAITSLAAPPQRLYSMSHLYTRREFYFEPFVW